MKNYSCSRCEESLENPEEDANYVKSTDFVVTKEKKVNVALKHTKKTKNFRDELIEYHDIGRDRADRIIARNDADFLETDEFEYSVNEDELNKEVVQVVLTPEENPEVLKVKNETRKIKDEKTGLVCKEKCVKEADQVIW